LRKESIEMSYCHDELTKIQKKDVNGMGYREVLSKNFLKRSGRGEQGELSASHGS
jgi:hypothetical protein